MTDDDTTRLSDATFEDAPISRRRFVRLSAATAGALSLPGAASAAGVSSPALTDEYEYVINHVGADEQVPTLATFEDAAGAAAFADRVSDARTTTEPKPAAHGYLTPGEVEGVLSIDCVSELRFSPGSNPFWKLDYYPDGTFPPVEKSVDFVDYEQLIDGMGRLERRHGDRLRFRSIGESPGYYNDLAGEVDPKDVWVAEVANDVRDDASFREKKKLVFSLSIHGDERAGVEAGTRFVERVLEGEKPELASALDDVALIFLYTNPDGWVARYPRYDDGGEEYERGTGGVDDPNRSYPTIGWINATHYPAEPRGADLADDGPGFDGDVPDVYLDRVPDSLGIVEHFRGYENLEYALDLHGMYASEYMIEGLVINDQYTYDELHSLYEYNRTLDARLEDVLGPLLEDNRDLFAALNALADSDEELPVPEEAYNYGTVYDTLEYSTSGILVSWMAQPVEQGGLGMKAMAPEIAYCNTPTPSSFAAPPDADIDVRALDQLFVAGYTTVIDEMVRHAAGSVTASLETAGRKTAVVTTDALDRRAEQLEFVSQSALAVSTAEEENAYTGRVLASGENRRVATPNPTEILGYQQRPYVSSPFVYLDDLDEDAEGDSFEEVTPAAVREGALRRSNGRPAYENVLVIHDGCDDAAYVDALDAYVESGGNLVLTDAGVGLLGAMENDLAADVGADAVTTERFTFAVFETDYYPHPLLTDTRPFYDELWKLSPMGYAIQPEDGEAPMTLVDASAFEAAGGRIAATTDGKVGAGSLSRAPPGEGGAGGGDGIHVIASLLPPANQRHLHPFGMADYTVSFFGSLVLTNALGYRQRRYRNGRPVRTFGSAPRS